VIQGMLDFDYLCGRAAMVYLFGGHHIQYTSLKDAAKNHPGVDVMANFVSSRIVYSSTLEVLNYPQVRGVALIAEGVPERHAREVMHVVKPKGVLIMGL
jgi:ATP citrate (pro-S)-lyase